MDSLFTWPAFVQRADLQTQIALLVLTALLLLLAWTVVEQLAVQLFRAVYELTPRGRAERQTRVRAIQGQVNAIMAQLAQQQALFMGPPKPPAAWQRGLRRLGWVLLVAWLALWVGLAWHFQAQARALQATWAAQAASSPFWTPAFEATTPDGLRLLSLFFSLQVVAVLVGLGWPRLRTWQQRGRA